MIKPAITNTMELRLLTTGRVTDTTGNGNGGDRLAGTAGGCETEGTTRLRAG